MFKSLVLVASLAAAMPASSAEFITNGNFETGTLAGWTATGNVGIAPTPVFGLSSPAYGRYLVDFNGGNLAPNGTLGQTIATSLGQAYTFSFDYGVTSGGAQSITASALDATSFAVIATNTVFTNSSLPTTYSFGFTALSSGTIIRFSDVASNPTNSQDIAIDNVSVTGPAIAAVAEPATWALLLAGFGMVGTAVRRRKSGIVTA